MFQIRFFGYEQTYRKCEQTWFLPTRIFCVKILQIYSTHIFATMVLSNRIWYSHNIFSHCKYEAKSGNTSCSPYEERLSKCGLHQICTRVKMFQTCFVWLWANMFFTNENILFQCWKCLCLDHELERDSEQIWILPLKTPWVKLF